MKITKKYLENIIKEEIGRLLSEKSADPTADAADLGRPTRSRRRLTPRQMAAARRAKASRLAAIRARSQDPEAAYPFDSEEDEDVEAVRAMAGTQVPRLGPNAGDEENEGGPTGDVPPSTVPGTFEAQIANMQRAVHRNFEQIDSRLAELEQRLNDAGID